MKQKLWHLALAALLYYIVASYSKFIFVVPGAYVELTSFLPPVLGLMWGPVSAIGVAAGEFFARYGNTGFREMGAAFLAAYIPYRVWHFVLLDKEKPAFAFNRTTLKKFILVLLLTTVTVAAFLGLPMTASERAQIFAGSDLAPGSALEFVGILFLNDFNLALFFGMPIFFILICYRYPFYMPMEDHVVLSENTYETNRLAVVMLTAFFFGLFALLDASGIIYNLDQVDTWARFNGEILTGMNLTLIALFYMLMKYRHSLMTHLMLMELATLFIVAFMLGSISFMALSRAIDEHVTNDLQKMSVIYRERLARTFNDTIMAVTSMSQLAVNELESRERLAGDEAYRQAYLDSMRRSFSAIAGNSPGSIGFYMLLPTEGGKTGFLCTRSPKNWGAKLPPFALYEGEDQNRYHLPEEKYLAKLSEPYWDKTAGRYMISYVAPLQKDGKFVGIVGIDIDFAYIIHEIERMSVYEHGFVRLLDKNGGVLYVNQPDLAAALNKVGFYETETYLSTGIWLTIAAFADDIFADRDNMLIHFVVGVLFIVIAVSVFSVWLARKGIHPLMVITGAARKIAAGDLDVQLPTESKYELGVLVNSIQEMVSKLEVYVYRDKLTGLRNAAAYMRETAELDRRREMDGREGNLHYGIVVFDLNYLKRTNDTYGHEAGNELIRRASRTICKVFAHSPVFRIGGDEFVAILEHHDYEHRDELFAAFDQKLTEESFEIEGTILPVSVARGLGLYQPGMDYASVFRQADDAMYQHKTALKAHRQD